MAAYIVIFSFVLVGFTGVATTVAFVVGAVTSILCGWIGMKIAVYTNVRATHQCWLNLASGYAVAIQGGSVMGLSLVNLWILIKAFVSCGSFGEGHEKEMYEAIAGYG